MHNSFDRFGFVSISSDDDPFPDYSELWRNILLDLPTPTRFVFIHLEAFIVDVDNDRNLIKIGLRSVAPTENIKAIATYKRTCIEQSASRILKRSIKVIFKIFD